GTGDRHTGSRCAVIPPVRPARLSVGGPTCRTVGEREPDRVRRTTPAPGRDALGHRTGARPGEASCPTGRAGTRGRRPRSVGGPGPSTAGDRPIVGYEQ